MDHEATRELLDLAAVEPGGLERLMAGDTPSAQAVAAHLAGCSDCSAELARLERASSLIRQVVRDQPPADLRERTLSAVRAAGVRRTSAVGQDLVPASSTGAGATDRRRSVNLGWVAAIAAAVLISVAATWVTINASIDQRLERQAETVEALQDVTIATLQVTGQQDSRRVALAGSGAGLSGDLIFSPSTSELVVVATGLTEPPAGQEYRCWVDLGGGRERVGKMFFSDDLAYWVGPVAAIEGLSGHARFGVSLVNLEGPTPDVPAVLEGDL